MGFVQDMCDAMNMAEVAADIGYDLNTDILVARAKQLIKLETDALAEKTSSNYNLHRKVSDKFKIIRKLYRWIKIHSLYCRSGRVHDCWFHRVFFFKFCCLFRFTIMYHFKVFKNSTHESIMQLVMIWKDGIHSWNCIHVQVVYFLVEALQRATQKQGVAHGAS